MERLSDMMTDEEKDILYQTMLVGVATALVCFGKCMPTEAVDGAAALIKAAQKKTEERYIPK